MLGHFCGTYWLQKTAVELVNSTFEETIEDVYSSVTTCYDAIAQAVTILQSHVQSIRQKWKMKKSRPKTANLPTHSHPPFKPGSGRISQRINKKRLLLLERICTDPHLRRDIVWKGQLLVMHYKNVVFMEESQEENKSIFKGFLLVL